MTSELPAQGRQRRASPSSPGTNKTAVLGKKRRREPHLDLEAASSSDSGSAPSNTSGGGLIMKGTVVEVEKRTGPGMNRLGGTARVMAVHAIGRDVCTYDVKYITEGGYEKGLDAGLLSLSPASEGSQVDGPGSTSNPKRERRPRLSASGNNEKRKQATSTVVDKAKTIAALSRTSTKDISASPLISRPSAPECSLGMLAGGDTHTHPHNPAKRAPSNSPGETHEAARILESRSGRRSAGSSRSSSAASSSPSVSSSSSSSSVSSSASSLPSTSRGPGQCKPKPKRKAAKGKQGGQGPPAIQSATLEAVATSATPIVARKRKKFQLRGSK